MTRDEVLQMARECGSTHKESLGVYQFFTEELERFANLVEQRTREECARICDAMAPHGGRAWSEGQLVAFSALTDAAKNIRATSTLKGKQ